MARTRKGLFITLEGPDGSGKSTQLQRLSEKLRQSGVPFILTREPGGGNRDSLAEKIRRLLLTPGKSAPTPEAELLLFLAARAQHVHDLIHPALQHGQVVVCERYADATFAYQVGGRGLSGAFVTAANRFATGGLTPDLTLLLDIPSARGLRRAYQAKAGHDRLESESLAFHRGVRAAYQRIAQAEPRRVRVIPADRSPDWVAGRIWSEVAERLGLTEGR